MKKLIIIWLFFITTILTAQTTSHWGATILNSSGQAVKGLTNVALYYSGGALAYNLSEKIDGGSGTGYYYNDNVAVGLYDLYVGAEIKKQAFWIGGNILTLMANNFNSSGELTTSGYEDGSINAIKLGNDIIDSTKIGTGKIGRTDLADNIVDLDKLSADVNSAFNDVEVRYNALREAISFAGEALNGGTFVDSGFTVPTGQTGQSTYRTAEFSVSSAVSNITARLVGKTLKFTVFLNVTEDFTNDLSITPRLTVKRTSGTASNQHTNTTAGYVTDDHTLYWFKYDYTVQAADTAYLVTFQVSSATSVSQDITLKLRSIDYEITATNTYTANALTAKEITDRELYTVNTTLSSMQNDISDNVIFNEYKDDNTVFGGEELNGAVETATGFYIPVSSTGTSTYNYPILNMEALSRNSRLLGKRIRLKVVASVTSGFTTYLSSPVSIKLNGLRSGVVVTNLQLATSKNYVGSTSDLYYYTTDYVVQSGDEELYPTLQIINSNSMETQLNYSVVSAGYAVLYDSTSGSSPNQETVEEIVTTAIGANNELGVVRNIIKVKKDFTGDFSTIDSALTSITDASATNPYEIRIYAGVYDEYYVTMKAHCYLRGMGGKPEDVWMRGKQLLGTSLADITLKSTLEFDVTGGLSNMKITMQNGRYAVHSETASFTDSTIVQTVENCIIQHYGNQEVIDSIGSTTNVWLSTNAWGCGMTGGEQIIIDHTYFGSVSTPFSFHTKAATTVRHPIKVIIRNSQIMSTFDHPVEAGNGTAISLQALGSSQPDVIIIENTSINGYIELTDTPWSLGIFTDQAEHDEIDIYGGGNTPVYYKPNLQGRVLKIQSTDSTASSSISIAGTNAETIFGSLLTSSGANGYPGWQRGTIDISDYAGGSSAADTAHYLSNRLGDCSSANKSITVSVNGGGAQTITFNQDYRGMSTADIVTEMNASLSGATVYSYNPGQESFPKFGNEYKKLKNVSNKAILRGMAVTDTLNFIGATKMTASDDIYDFVGIAAEDIKPDSTGWVRILGYVAVSSSSQGVQAKQWTYNAGISGTNYGIDPDHPGYFKKDATPTLIRGTATGIAKMLGRN